MKGKVRGGMMHGWDRLMMRKSIERIERNRVGFMLARSWGFTTSVYLHILHSVHINVLMDSCINLIISIAYGLTFMLVKVFYAIVCASLLYFRFDFPIVLLCFMRLFF